ncbi:MAG: cellulose biosynthesis cyclic di-GMP-binding regulatory protein BcsB [Synechococcales cyanobacterium CRU_2_2]|nr:cellulose biosynthesis cyclic di-GMP-binding regulatory protein BcsB [Synechococcales cyanobacterium CRU_2_2]
MKRPPHRPPLPIVSQRVSQRRQSRYLRSLLRLLLVAGVGSLAVLPLLPMFLPMTSGAIAQEEGVESQEDALIREYALPSEPPPAPVYRPAPAPEYDPAPAPAPDYGAAPEEPYYAPEPEPEYVAPDPEPVLEPEFVPPEPVSEPDVPDSVLPETEAGAPAGAAGSASGTNRQPATAQAKKTPEKSGPRSRYILEFNRSPIVGNSLKMQGVYSERRLGFNRPTAWDVKSVQALVRYQHSPDLLADRSNLTVRVNGTSVGSVPLNQKKSEIGEVLVNIPANLIQDYNEIVLVAQQNNDKRCSNPADPALWTEILPDSKLVLDYQPKAVALAFDHYPYPFFDKLALDANHLAYVLPQRTDSAWLTAVSRFHAGMGRRAQFRPLESRFVRQTAELEWNESLVVMGTPEAQPAIASLKQLPFKVAKGKLLDGKGTALPNDVGVLMLTSLNNSANPVLVATGNGPEGVLKAVRFLQEKGGEAIGTGQGILVTEDSPRPTPKARAWPGHLPTDDNFRLSSLKRTDGDRFQDVTVRTSAAPPVEVDFRALPDDHFLRGNSMELVYSYGPQLDPRTSSLEVAIDDVTIAGKRLTNLKGETHATYNVTLPEGLLKPDSKLRVGFNLNPRSGSDCGIVADRQLWATLHGDTSFQLKREQSVDLPNLKLAQVGYPFAEPQDLSTTTLVMPDQASPAALGVMLEISERLGRLSESEDIQLEAYLATALPEASQNSENLIAIGDRDRFPLPTALESGKLALGKASARQLKSSGTAMQTLTDRQGVIKQIISPWNKDRVVLALAAQTDKGLDTIQQILKNDTWFFQLDGDTVLVSANGDNPSPYDPKAYEFEILKDSKTRRFEQVSLLGKASRFVQERWFVLPTAVVSLALLMYGISQISLKRIGDGGSK